MKNQRFKAVLFDMDGVVLDSMREHSACWQEILAQEGFQVDQEFVLRYEGNLSPDVLCELLGRRPGEQELRQARAAMPGLLARQAEMYLSRHRRQVGVFPDAPEFLASLARAGVPRALVTSSHASVVQQSLPPEVLASFSVVLTANDVTRHKPHPEPYRKAAEALELPAADCLVIENAPAGIQSARAAGATCFALTTTLAPHHLSGAHRVFASLCKVREFLGL